MDKPHQTPVSSQTTSNETVPVNVHGSAVSEEPALSTEVGVPQEDDPAITLDYKSTEMKQVLEKASSTEVIPALSLDARRKSNSVTSLGSSCNRSDSFRSVSSVVSNGATLNKSGSSTSVDAIKHGSLVRVRSESGRPLSDAVSIGHYCD